MLRDTAREEGATKDFLSLSKKVLVTLICVICSFFSTARRTNKEAPPLLSGFWVRRYGRRRGLRNSLRSDSPRPFSSVFLATSPPDKGGIGGSCLYSNPPLLLPLLVFLIPLLVATLLSSPLYFLAPHPAMLRGTAGRSLEVALYSFAMSRGSGLYFFYFNPLAPWALPLYSLTETQGERFKIKTDDKCFEKRG